MRYKRLYLTAISVLAAMIAAFAGPALASDVIGVPTDGAIGFQPSASPVMDMIASFHNGPILWVITLITLLVMVLMIYILFRFSEKRNPVPSKTTHHVGLEVAWTIVPVFILLFLLFPSMKLLYFQDVVPESDMTIKVTGNTWNWEYAYPDYEDKVGSFISNVLEKDDAQAAGKPYLLGTDAPLVVPVEKVVKVLVTSNNNLHAFAVPSFGIKMDAIPGRINETWFKATKKGVFYGQCSELCGVRHAYMPIEIHVVDQRTFNRWIADGGPVYDQNYIQKIATSGGPVGATAKR